MLYLERGAHPVAWPISDETAYVLALVRLLVTVRALVLLWLLLIQRDSEADSQSCSIEISDRVCGHCMRMSKIFARATNYVS